MTIRPELLLDETLRIAERIRLPQHFTSFGRAASFAELRGWDSGRVQMFRDGDGIYRVIEAGADCGCRHADEVRRG